MHVVVVLEDDDVICGVLELVSEDTHIFIENIAVHPGHQGRGLGCMLLTHAEKRPERWAIQKSGSIQTRLFTSNLGFYDTNGYSVLEESIMIPGCITVHLHKML